VLVHPAFADPESTPDRARKDALGQECEHAAITRGQAYLVVGAACYVVPEMQSPLVHQTGGRQDRGDADTMSSSASVKSLGRLVSAQAW
jgi:hypothetical protein